MVTAVGFDVNRNDEVSIVSIPFENQLQAPEQIHEPSPLDDMNQISKLVMMLVGFIASMLILKGLMKKLKNEKITIGTMGLGSGDFVDNSLAELTPSLAGGMLGMGSEATGSSTQLLDSGGDKKKNSLLEVGNIEDEISDDALRKKVRKEKIVNYVQKNPTEAAKLINSWLREEEY